MLEEQISVCRRDIVQNKGESAADFAARAESSMSLFEELLKGSGFTNDCDGVDKYSTDRKRSQAIITGLRPVYFGMITQIFSAKNDKSRWSTVTGTIDKPTLITSLLECDALVKTQPLGDPEWGEQSYKGKDDKKVAGKETTNQKWERITKAEVKNLKTIDSGKKKHPCAGDLPFTKHDWAPGTGAVGRFDPRGTRFRPCAWELNDGVCTRENCQSSHKEEAAATIAGYPPGWHSYRRLVQTPSHSFKAGGGEAKATDMWSPSELRDEVVETKVELKAAVESMKSDLMKEFATILKTQAVEHSKALAQVQVTKTETRSAGARRAEGVFSGQGTTASVTAFTAEPPEEGQEDQYEIFRSTISKKRSTQTELSWQPQDLPKWEIPDYARLEKFEDDPLTIAWIDDLVERNAEGHEQIDAAYLCDTIAGGTLDNANVAMNAVL